MILTIRYMIVRREYLDAKRAEYAEVRVCNKAICRSMRLFSYSSDTLAVRM